MTAHLRIPPPRASCPSCQGALQLRPEHLGGTVGCPRCHKTFQAPASVPVRCPECQQSLRVGAAHFGKQCQCPACKKHFTIECVETPTPPAEGGQRVAPAFEERSAGESVCPAPGLEDSFVHVLEDVRAQWENKRERLRRGWQKEYETRKRVEQELATEQSRIVEERQYWKQRLDSIQGEFDQQRESWQEKANLLQEQLQQLRQERESGVRQLASEKEAQLNQERARAAAGAQQLAEERKHWQEQLEVMRNALSKQYHGLREQLESVSAERDRLQYEIHDVRLEVEKRSANAERLARLTREVELLRSERDRYQLEREGLSKKLLHLQTELSRQGAHLEEANRRRVQAEQERVQALIEAHAQWEQQRQSLVHEKERQLQQEQERARAEHQRWQEQLKAERRLAEEQRSGFQGIVQRLEKEALALRQENETTRKEMDNLRAELAQAPPAQDPVAARGNVRHEVGHHHNGVAHKGPPPLPPGYLNGQKASSPARTESVPAPVAGRLNGTAAAPASPPPLPAQVRNSQMEPHQGANGRAQTEGLAVAPRTKEGQAGVWPQGLSAGHFRRIAANGFGDGRNTYAWSCAWFKDHVYIGTNRHVLVVLKKRVLTGMRFQTWPVPLPESDRELDLRAQIWRYSPDEDSWDRIYRSPLTQGVGGKEVPLASGFRNMGVFQGKSDPAPALYTVANCGSFGRGPVLLRSADGLHFEIASEPGLGVGDPNITAFRGTLSFKGKLFTTPSGSRGGQANTSFNAVILCSDDPVNGKWAASNPPSFGDSTNVGIFDIGVCGHYLYAGTINVRQGCQLWRTDAEGPPPHRWTKVFDRGADRGPHNQLIISFADYKGDLYLGTGIQNGGHDRFNNIGPAAGEIIRVRPDGSWDLVMGEPRLTRQGLKVPTSGLAPGFDNPFAGYIWRMCPHDGSLYVGTFDSSSFLPFSDPNTWPEAVKRILDPQTLERYMEKRGGCELWRTNDGDHWVPVTRNGFGNPYNWGIRALLSTPRGLFVGTANPFGPHVAVKGANGWRYEENPRGGLEIWHGSLAHAGTGDLDSAAAGCVDSNPLYSDDVTPVSAILGSGTEEVEPDPPRLAEAALARLNREELLRALGDLSTPIDDFEAHRNHDMEGVETESDQVWRKDPLAQLAIPDKDMLGLSEDIKEELDDYYAHSTLRNVGYWRNQTVSPREAAKQLAEEVLSQEPEQEGSAKGQDSHAFLVIDDETGALSQWLIERRPTAQVTALRFHKMNRKTVWHSDSRIRVQESPPDRLAVSDKSFDRVLWIEGPSACEELGGSHKKGPTRMTFLREVSRVLKPGGCLLAADLIVDPSVQRQPEIKGICLTAEHLSKEYEYALLKAGFVEPQLLDVTRETWHRFFRHSREHVATKRLFQQIDEEQQNRILAVLPGGNQVVAAYFLVRGFVPEKTH